MLRNRKEEDPQSSKKKSKPFKPLFLGGADDRRITLEGWNHNSDDDDDYDYDYGPPGLSTSFQDHKKPTIEVAKKAATPLPTRPNANRTPEKSFNGSYLNHQFRIPKESQRNDSIESMRDDMRTEEIASATDKIQSSTPYSKSNYRLNGPLRGTTKLHPITNSLEHPVKEKSLQLSHLNYIQKRINGMTFNKKPVPLQVFSLEKTTRRNSQDEEKCDYTTTRVHQTPNGIQNQYHSHHERSFNLPCLGNLLFKLEDAPDSNNNSILDTILKKHIAKKEPKAVNNSIIDLNMTRHGSIQGLGPQGKLKDLMKEGPAPNTLLVMKKKHAFNKAVGLHMDAYNHTKSTERDTSRNSNRTPTRCQNIPVAIKPQTIRFVKPLPTINAPTKHMKLAQVLENVNSHFDDKTSIQNILRKNKIENKPRPGSREDLNGVVKLLLDYNTQAYKAQLNHSIATDQSKSILEPNLNKCEWEQSKGGSSFRINEESTSRKLKKMLTCKVLGLIGPFHLVF